MKKLLLITSLLFPLLLNAQVGVSVAVGVGRHITPATAVNPDYCLDCDSTLSDPINVFGDSLIAWYDAIDSSSFTLNANKIAQWNDLSGNGNHAVQGTDGNRPTWSDYGDSIYFGSSKYLEIAEFAGTDSVEQTFTIITIGRNTATSGRFFDGTTANSRPQFGNTTSNWFINAGTTLGTTGKDSDRHLFMTEFNGTSSSITVDNSAYRANASGNAGTENIDGLYIGRNQPGTVYLSGSIWAIVIVKGTPTEDQWTNVRDYLNQRHQVYDSFEEELSTWYASYAAHDTDNVLIYNGDSYSSNTSYTSSNINASYEPPGMEYKNLFYYMAKQLLPSWQEYRKYGSKIEGFGGATDVFTDILGGGSASGEYTDNSWGWKTISNFQYLWTKVIAGGTNAGVSYEIPDSMIRCNFIYHAYKDWAATTTVTVGSGDGAVEVWNGSAWVEANGYTFSAKTQEAAIWVASESDSIYNNQYQKRLHMKTVYNSVGHTITIQNSGAGDFAYWGIEYSPLEDMFMPILAAKGGQDIVRMRGHEAWAVDSFAVSNATLVVTQVPAVNEDWKSTGLLIRPDSSMLRLEEYIDSIENKDYTPDQLIIVQAPLASQGNIVDQTTGEFQSEDYTGYWNNPVDIFEYNRVNDSMVRKKDVAFLNTFPAMMDTACNLASATCNIYTSAIVGSTATGATLTADGTHHNDRAVEAEWAMIDSLLPVPPAFSGYTITATAGGGEAGDYDSTIFYLAASGVDDVDAYDDTSDTLFVYSESDPDIAYSAIEPGQRDTCISIGDNEYIEIRGIRAHYAVHGIRMDYITGTSKSGFTAAYDTISHMGTQDDAGYGIAVAYRELTTGEITELYNSGTPKSTY